MSILLDALRKSEKDKQKVEAPDIHSGEQGNPTSGFSRKGWWLSVIVIVIVCMGASLAWYQLRKPDEVSESPAIATATTSAQDQDASGPVGVAKNDKLLAVAANTGANKARTPVEAYGQTPAGATKPTAGAGAKANASVNAKKNKPATNAGKKKTSANNKQANNKKANKSQAANKQAANKQNPGGKSANNKAGNRQAGNKPAANNKQGNQTKRAKPAANNAASTASAQTNEKAFRPKPPPPISYWELPDAVRNKIPEMKFTVLVYAKDPADRFVLIDGQRYRQGEKVQPDLFVREIRRKGVVFKYRLYKFLVER